jgi:hypothetical protein
MASRWSFFSSPRQIHSVAEISRAISIADMILM